MEIENIQFQIAEITASTYDTSFGGYPWVVNVCVHIQAKEWTKIKKAGQLGLLYGCDISNAVYRINSAIPSYNPTVNDKQRASRGLKVIQLEYYFKDPCIAKELGLKVIQDKFASYADRVMLFNKNI